MCRLPLRLAIAFAVTAGLLVGAGPHALACSCAGGEPRAALQRADAAIVGALERISGNGEDGTSILNFRIEKPVKGSFGPTVDVLGQVGNGASCGIEVQVGQRTGLFLDRVRGAWRAISCSQVDADILLAAARPLPKPDGVPPAALVVAVEWGEMRMLSLDSSGRTLAYGAGGPVLREVAVCPGGRFAVGWGRQTLVVREVRTMRMVQAVNAAPSLPDGAEVLGLACRDAEARDVVLFASTLADPVAQGEVIAMRDRKVAHRSSGEWKAAAFLGGTVYLSGGSFGHTLEALDIATGSVRPIAHITKIADPEHVDQAVPSPDGRYLAATAWVPASGHGPPPSRVLLVDLAASPPTVSSGPLPGGEGEGRIGWISRDRFVFATPGGGASVVFDTKLRRLGTFGGWSAIRPLVAGDVAYGMAGGALLAVRLPAGPVYEMRKFDTPLTYSIALVPGARPPSSLGRVVTPPAEEPAPSGPLVAPPTSSVSSPLGWLPLALLVVLALGVAGGVAALRRRPPQP